MSEGKFTIEYRSTREGHISLYAEYEENSEVMASESLSLAEELSKKPKSLRKKDLEALLSDSENCLCLRKRRISRLESKPESLDAFDQRVLGDLRNSLVTRKKLNQHLRRELQKFQSGKGD